MPKKQTKDGERFLTAMRLIVSIPKEEIDRREEEYKKSRSSKKTPKVV